MESGIFASALAIAGCAGGVRTRPIAFSDLSGWDVADHEAAMAAFRATLPLARPGGGTTAADWAALSPFAEDRRPAKRVFESAFRPVLIDDGGRPLFTGYFEPELDGARRPHGPYRHPIHARPADLSDAPYHDAAAIRRGALEGRGLELLWLADPVEAFFLHIQGSGRIRLAEGGVARVGFAGKNNRPYVAIGRLLVERGELALEQADAETIKAWLRRDEAAGSALMDENPSYVFFEEKPGLSADQGPIGALGAPLTPGLSVAVDPALHPLGAPIWVEADGVEGFERKLVVAQDVGGAIKGAQRADLFFGSGAEAGALAGRVRAGGRLVTLLPRTAAERLA